MKNLSIAILAKNEKDNLYQLLPTLSFVSEIIIINDNSADKTQNIVKKAGVKIFSHSLRDDFSQQRQFALEKATNDWVFFIDADERLSPELIKWLKAWQPENNTSGYSFKRIDWFYGRTLRFGETGNIRVTRLVNRNLGKFYRPVHETWQGEKFVRKTNFVINHYPHQSIHEFLSDVNFYSTLNAQYWHQQKKTVSIFAIVFYPFAKFVYTYFLKLGFLDGAAGFIYSFMMSFHSFLSRAKLFVNYQ